MAAVSFAHVALPAIREQGEGKQAKLPVVIHTRAKLVDAQVPCAGSLHTFTLYTFILYMFILYIADAQAPCAGSLYFAFTLYTFILYI